MIVYKRIKTFQREELCELFSSVGWGPVKYPGRLILALENSDTVVSAWDGDSLIGLVNALSDRVMTVYIHYVLTHGSYQKKGIGRSMVNEILEIYRDYQHIVLVSNSEVTGFFEKSGFQKGKGVKTFEIRRVLEPGHCL